MNVASTRRYGSIANYGSWFRSFFKSLHRTRIRDFLPAVFELGAGNDVVVALAPSRAVVGMVDGDGLEFGVIVGEVDDEFGQSGLEILDGVQVKVFPASSGDGGSGDDDGIQKNVFVGKGGAQSGSCVGSEHSEEGQFVLVRDFDVDGEQIGAREKDSHVAVEVCGMDAHGNGVFDLSANFTFGFVGLDVLHGGTGFGPKISGGIEEASEPCLSIRPGPSDKFSIRW